MSPLKQHLRSLPPAERQDRTQVISHELRTPLAIIRGYAQMLGEESGSDLVHLTEPLLEAVDRLGRVVEALVDFEAEPVAQPALEASESRIPLDHWMGRIGQQVVSRHADCAVELVFDLESGISLTAGMADTLSRAVDAVLDNAIRFTGQGRVSIRSRKRDDGLHLSITDEGPGFPKGPVSLTGAFQQGSRGTTRRHGGLGLGLHTAKKAVSSLSGSIQLQSRTDRAGARVTVHIPLAEARTGLTAVPKSMQSPSIRRAA